MPLSGKEMLKKYLKKGWQVNRQRGSHVQISLLIGNLLFNETIPMHKELKKGLEHYLLKRLEEVSRALSL